MKHCPKCQVALPSVTPEKCPACGYSLASTTLRADEGLDSFSEFIADDGEVTQTNQTLEKVSIDDVGQIDFTISDLAPRSVSPHSEKTVTDIDLAAEFCEPQATVADNGVIQDEDDASVVDLGAAAKTISDQPPVRFDKTIADEVLFNDDGARSSSIFSTLNQNRNDSDKTIQDSPIHAGEGFGTVVSDILLEGEGAGPSNNDRTISAPTMPDAYQKTLDSGIFAEGNLPPEVVAAAKTKQQEGATIMTSIKSEHAGKNPTLGGSDRTYLKIQPRSFVETKNTKLRADADYQILDVLGEGGMGVVYSARQGSIDRTVAVKMLKKKGAEDLGQREKFLAEAAVTGELEHPNIVPIYDLGMNPEGALFYAMRRVQGTPWHKKIRGMTLHQNLEVLMRVADAVAFAHDHGIIHRDLKPENTMLGDYGEVLVMDWGLALPVGEKKFGGIAIKASMAGTPAYMAPEMAAGPFNNLGVGCDIYLLGAILFEIVTGLPPHSGDTVMQCLMNAAKNDIRPTKKQGELIDAAMKAMAFRPEDRFLSVKDFQKAIAEYLAHSESIVLASKSEEELKSAEKSSDYQAYSRALFGFQQALELWPGNERAKSGVREAVLRYAQAAKEKGDLDLAASLLDPSDDEHSFILKGVVAEQKERSNRLKRIRNLKRVAAVLGIAMFLVISIALGYVLDANRKERLARVQAETESLNAKWQEVLAREAERTAVLQRDRAEEAQLDTLISEIETAVARDHEREQREIAENQELLAISSRVDAVLSERRAVAARDAAEDEQLNAIFAALEAENARDNEAAQRAEAETQELFARYNKILAEESEKVAVSARHAAEESQAEAVLAQIEAEQQRELAEYEAYVARVNAASARIDENAFERATQLLQQCAPANGQRDYRDWEWARLNYLCTQSKQTLNFDVPVESVRFSADQNWIIAGGASPIVQIVSRDNQKIHQLNVGGTRVQAIDTIAGERGETIIAIGTNNTSGLIQIWNGATGKLLQTLNDENGHSLAITSLEFSPDKKQLLSASLDNTAKIWELETGKVVQTFQGHKLWVWNARWSPDSKNIVTASEDGTALVWEVATGKSGTPFRGHTGPVYAADFSPDGEWIATSGIDGKVLVWQWSDRFLKDFDYQKAVRDFDAGRPIDSQILGAIRILNGHTAAVRDLHFGGSPSEAVIVSTGHDNTIRLWDANSGRLIKSLRGHGQWLRAVDLSQDGKWVISAGIAGDGRIWEINAYNENRVLQAKAIAGHDDAVLTATFSPNGEEIVTASRDRRAIAWKVATGEPIHTYRDGHSFLATAVLPFADGRRIATGAVDNSTRIWDSESGNELVVLEGTGNSPALVLNQTNELIFTANDQFGAALWNTKNGDLIKSFNGEHQSQVTALAISPDEQTLATGDALGRVVLWDVATGSKIESLSRHVDKISGIAFVDNQNFITVCRDYVGFVWKRGIAEPTQILRHNEPIVGVSILDSNRAITLSPKGHARVWNIASSTIEREWKISDSNQTNVSDFALSNDKQWIAVCDAGTNQISIWNSSSGNEHEATKRMKGSSESSEKSSETEVYSVAFSPEMTSLYTVGGDRATSWLIDLKSEQPPKRRQTFAPQGVISAVAYSDSPNRPWMATGSWDGAIRVWDRTTQQLAFVLRNGHSQRVRSVLFFDEGERIASCGEDGKVIVWHCDSKKIEHVVDTGTQRVLSLTRDPIEGWFASGHNDGTVRVWNRELQPMKEWSGHRGATTKVLTWRDGDSVFIASAGTDNQAVLWDYRTGAALQRFEGHSAAINDLAVSKSKSRLATASNDFSVKLWDLRTGKEVLSMRGHEREVSTVSFSPRGETLLSASLDGTAILWLTEGTISNSEPKSASRK